MSFENLNLIQPILKALADERYTTPTPIQEQAIPVILQQKDLIGCAQTGTGKTAAFAVPILQLLYPQRNTGKKTYRHIKSLILTPTRELALQIADSFSVYGQHTGLTNTVVFGGVSQRNQEDKLRFGVDVLIATPGRLLDLMNQKIIGLEHVQIFVLDEADRMLDMGFIHDIKKVLVKLPVRRQTLLFSATMPREIISLANSMLNSPTKIVVTPDEPTVDAIQQRVYFVSKQNKKELLVDVLKDKSIDSALVFTRTKHGADHVTRILNKAKIRASAIHGNKSQNARQHALDSFKKKEIRVLVATDIAARGIDIDELSHVINYEIPNIPETYIHRIGRTGRAGQNGIALSFCDAEEKAYLKDIQKLISFTIPVVNDHGYDLLESEKSVVTPFEKVQVKRSSKPSKPAESSKSVQKPKKKWFGRGR